MRPATTTDQGDDRGPRRERPVGGGDVFDRRPGSLFHQDPGGDDDVREAMFELLRELVATKLTVRQRDVVERFYVEGRTQAEIAAELGISQQVVSKTLFGVVRDGRRIGGAIRRLRQLCDEHGIDPGQWV